MTRQTHIRRAIGWLLAQVGLLIAWWDLLPTVTEHPWWLAAIIATEILMAAVLIDIIRRSRKPHLGDAQPDRDAAKPSTPPNLSRSPGKP